MRQLPVPDGPIRVVAMQQRLGQQLLSALLAQAVPDGIVQRQRPRADVDCRVDVAVSKVNVAENSQRLRLQQP